MESVKAITIIIRQALQTRAKQKAKDACKEKSFLDKKEKSFMIFLGMFKLLKIGEAFYHGVPLCVKLNSFRVPLNPSTSSS